MSYHRYFGHENDLLIGVMGHYQSEQFTIQLLERILMQAQPELTHCKDTSQHEPYKEFDKFVSFMGYKLAHITRAS